MPAKLKVDRTEFADLAAKGWTNEQLRAHFKVNAATISRIRKATGTSTAIRLTPERKARIAAMLDDGWSFEEITRTEGADRTTLNRHFPGRQWTPGQIYEHISSVRPIFREIRRAERFAALGQSVRWESNPRNSTSKAA